MRVSGGSSMRLLQLLFVTAFCGCSAQGVTFTWADIGDAGNANDPGNTTSPNTFGAVGYDYRIATHEVTNGQYADFLNAVADDDPNGLYNANMGTDPNFGGILQSGVSPNFSYSVKPNFADKPVTYVSWFDAARFVNWLNNGQGTGGTEFGAYWLIQTDMMTVLEPTRMAGASFFIPSENEWYKAAYYQPGSAAANGDDYWKFPTQNELAPLSGPPPGGANSANYNRSSLTNVGAYTSTSNHYGTFDMAGNVWEWNEAIPSSGNRNLRGGSYINSSSQVLESSFNISFSATTELQSVGFRVAQIPEPSVANLALLTILVFAHHLLRRMARQTRRRR